MNNEEKKKFKDFLKQWKEWKLESKVMTKDLENKYSQYWETTKDSTGEYEYQDWNIKPWIFPTHFPDMERKDWNDILKESSIQRLNILERRMDDIEKMLTQILETLARLEKEVNPSVVIRKPEPKKT